MVVTKGYLELMGRELEWDYIFTISSITPTHSHIGQSCPAEAMRVIIGEGLKKHPESETLLRMWRADGQGRVCESSEISALAKFYLKDHPTRET